MEMRSEGRDHGVWKDGEKGKAVNIANTFCHKQGSHIIWQPDPRPQGWALGHQEEAR